LSQFVEYVEKVKKKENKIIKGVAIWAKMLFNSTCRHKTFFCDHLKKFRGEKENEQN